MMDDLRWWKEQAGRYPLLSKDEELELGRLIRQWLDHPEGPSNAPRNIQRAGRRARERFIAANLRLVIHYISSRHNRIIRSAEQMDLIQAGNLGLIAAVEKFDPALGYRFSTYAYWWIRQAITRYRDTASRVLQLSGAQSQRLATLAVRRTQLAQALGRQPTKAELATSMGLTPAGVDELLASDRTPSSLDQPLDGEGSQTIADVVAAPGTDDAISPEQMAVICERLSALRSADQQLLREWFALDCAPAPVEEIAARHGMTLARLEERVDLALLLLRAQDCRVQPLPAATASDGECEQLALLLA